MKPNKAIHKITFGQSFRDITETQSVNKIESGQLISIFKNKGPYDMGHIPYGFHMIWTISLMT